MCVSGYTMVPNVMSLDSKFCLFQMCPCLIVPIVEVFVKAKLNIFRLTVFIN